MKNKLFDFIDEAFYINLDTRTDKKILIEQHFLELGIKKFIKRYAAKTPADINLGFKLQENGKYEHIAYSTACLYTHASIVAESKRKNRKNILIFEDDAVFYIEGGYNPIECIKTAINGLKNIPNWEILYLGTNPGTKETEFNMVLPNLVKIKEAIGTHSIIINHTIFDKILNEYSIHSAFDIYLSNVFNEKYLVYPICTYQRDGVPNDISIIPYNGMNKEFWLNGYNKKINKLYC